MAIPNKDSSALRHEHKTMHKDRYGNPKYHSTYYDRQNNRFQCGCGWHGPPLGFTVVLPPKLRRSYNPPNIEIIHATKLWPVQ